MAYDGSYIDHDIALEQFKAVRHEIDRRAEFDLRNQRNGSIAIAILIFFSIEVINDSNLVLQNLGLYLAAVVALLTAIRQSNSKWFAHSLGTLSKNYERRVFPSEVIEELGWEHFLANERKSRPKWKSLTIAESYAWFGLSIVLFCFASAYAFGAI